MTLLIKNGHLIDPTAKIDAKRDLLIRDGKIEEVAAPGAIKTKAAKTFDAKSLIVAPGFIDLHVHLREPGQSHKETIATGTAAALAGGFTSLCCMPNTSPVNDSAEITRWLQQPERAAQASVFPIAAATIGSQGDKVTDFIELKDAGAVAVSDDGRPILRDHVMAEVLRAAKRVGLPVIQHAEDPNLSYGCTINAGPTAQRLGLRGMPAEAESNLVERDLRLLAEIGGHLHVAHVSTAKSVAAIRRAKKQGLHVSAEATPHHITLLDEHVGDYDTNFKMCPPLRAAADREALLEALADGTIDCIATDHAPHAAHEKLQEFDRAPNGITGLETAVGIALQVLHHHRKLPLQRVIELLSVAPARIVGLKKRGTLAAGSIADITIIDPNRKWTFYVAESKSKSRNTPFDGWTFRGAAVQTFVAR